MMSHRIDDVASIPALISPGLVSRRLADIDITEGLRAFVLDDESDDDPTPRPGSPMIVITPPSVRLKLSQRRRQLSTRVVPTTPRPRLRRKATTAPSGALQLYSGIKPQPPRRAISARTARPFQTSLSRYRRTPVIMPPTPRFSRSGAPTSRSLISRRKTNRRMVGKMGTRQRQNVLKTPLQPTKKFQLLSEALSDRAASFSEKARVRKTLRTKKMGALKTHFVDSRSKDLPARPSSVVTTPQELYGLAGSGRGFLPSAALQPDTRKAQLSASPRRAKHFSLPLTPNAQRRASLKHNRAAPYEVATKRTVYLPGPIELEEKTVVTPRRGSIATLEPVDLGSGPKGKRFSDMVALDGVVMFFEDLGMWEPATEKCLDRHWVERRNSSQISTPRRTVPPVPQRPPNPSVPYGDGGLFSLKRALQQEDQSPASSPSTPGRQKGRLRQLLKSSRTKH